MGTRVHRAHVLGVTLKFTFSSNLEREGNVCIICKANFKLASKRLKYEAEGLG